MPKKPMIGSSFAELLDSHARDSFIKGLAEQGHLLLELIGNIKPKPLTARQRKRLERERVLSEFAQRLHTLALNLGAQCECGGHD